MFEKLLWLGVGTAILLQLRGIKEKVMENNQNQVNLAQSFAELEATVLDLKATQDAEFTRVNNHLADMNAKLQRAEDIITGEGETVAKVQALTKVVQSMRDAAANFDPLPVTPAPVVDVPAVPADATGAEGTVDPNTQVV